jgi:hypothetical protein
MPEPRPTQGAPRVVVLSKPHPLTSYLVARLADEGVLTGILHEERFLGFRDRVKYLRSNVRREGFWHTVDAVAYELFDRVTRRDRLKVVAARLVPVVGHDAGRGVVPVSVRSLNSPEARAKLQEWQPDLIIVHATGILKRETYGLARVGALNIHCGVLPEYRGHASTFHALARGDLAHVGVTVHHVAPVVDTGRAVGIGCVPFAPDDDDVTLWCKAFRSGVDIVLDQVHRVARGDALAEVPYEGTFGPHYKRRGLFEHLRLFAFTLPRLRASARASGDQSPSGAVP